MRTWGPIWCLVGTDRKGSTVDVGEQGRAEDGDEVATILEFFGIKLTTPNQQLAALAKRDVGELFHSDIKTLLSKPHGGVEDNGAVGKKS